ncbi:acetyl-CoA synthetase-like protein [Stereum hirsutum FP-91666 SS1]|uniref:Acetyl-CoA synthetase-like protein n=1 Tax=Stereum hirsutum (strain FP-91666) TaxID=721885 RepID=R7RXY1_STEHR|nr:acetyl-CoA synthetase-like protein [Stereum hirsutum FP-91666 SS1]EIM79653.1 acetyl-CoA synthetase-like protein [Stereum hirsutum FP-91666 SS1]
MLFKSLARPLVPPPDDLTVPQFIFDDVLQHSTYTKRPANIPCLIDEDNGREVTLDDLRHRTDDLARTLRTVHGIGRGDVVALIAPNHVDYPVCVWAVHRLGGIVAAMSPGLTREEMIPLLRISKPTFFIGHLDNFDTVCSSARTVAKSPPILVLDGEHVQPAQENASTLTALSIHHAIQHGAYLPAFDEFKLRGGEAKTTIAFLCFSSGTTGQPKAVAISHFNVMCNVIQTATFNWVNEEYCPLADRRFRPGDVCTGAAAPISAELTTELLNVMPDIHLGQGYGMTESCAAVSMFPISQKVGTLGSGGQLVSGTVARVVKTDGSMAGFDERGELWVKGGQIALGYYGDEVATKESFIDSWYRTGDEIIMRENGDIFITDRIKELIKSKGFQVAPAELEGHLLTHPDVADAGVIGIPDDYAGEVPLAFIALRPATAANIAADQSGAAEKAVRKSIFKHVSQAKSSYKWLTGGIVFVEAIPKSTSGKILRRVLREHAKSFGCHGDPPAKL